MNWLIERRGVKGWALAVDRLRTAQVECHRLAPIAAQTVGMNEEHDDETSQRKGKKQHAKRGV
jgi:hypothetical protein